MNWLNPTLMLEAEFIRKNKFCPEEVWQILHVFTEY